MTKTTKTYRILWGHSGTMGREWTTAREASRYAAVEWGTVDAVSPEEAVAMVAEETGTPVADHHTDGDEIHVIFVT